jgi:signal peptidase I
MGEGTKPTTLSEAQKPGKGSRAMKVISIAGTVLVSVMVAVTYSAMNIKLANVRAFRVPSSSMCPTVCENERVLASTDVDTSTAPRRGEIVLFSHKLGDRPNTILFKRVIGIAGDEVSEKEGIVQVNGNPSPWVRPRPVCGQPATPPHQMDELPRFAAVKVPEGQFFVIGDDLLNSFDSRFPQFGLVSAEELRGHLLYIYWSSESSRIGCGIH